MTAASDEPAQSGSWGKVPGWILDTDAYLPAYFANVPEDQRKKGDDKPLNASELRVYIALRTFADRKGKVKARAKTIAERAKVDKSGAERAISKFRRLGWLTSRRHYRDDGSISRCDYFLRDSCPTADDFHHPQHNGGVPAESRVGYPPDHGKSSRGAAGAKNTPDEHTNRTQERTEPTPNTSDRFAPSGVGDEDDDEYGAEDDDQEPAVHLDARAPVRTKFANWRHDDLKRLAGFVGSDHIISDGTGSSPVGAYSMEKLYDSLRYHHNTPKVWPGKWAAKVEKNSGGGGVVEWLARYGLAPGDSPQPSEHFNDWTAA